MIKRIILFGSPGSGKGTQAVVLAKYFNLRHISLGDILREEVKKNSELGKTVKGYMEEGKLVPDEVVARVIENNVSNENFILDGYPRNISQAKNLDQIFNRKKIDIDAFIYLYIEQKVIVDRLSKRRVCKSCGAIYHLDNMPPKEEGKCDSCAGELIQRKDDTSEVINKRWEVFTQESEEILKFYKSKGKLIAIDGNGNKDVVFDRIKDKLQ